MTPLDDNIFHRYFERKCEVCFQTIHLREEHDYQCEGCTTLMCQDCAQKVHCMLCATGSNNAGCPTFCADCMQSCQACGEGATFHPFCKRFHACVHGSATRTPTTTTGSNGKRSIGSTGKKLGVEKTEFKIRIVKRKLWNEEGVKTPKKTRETKALLN
ncbi:expressed unknown protein [Seminavis robusta]|uniref:Uncharacterized protein n=1 Tax=Seminavis robusta TaxID=568900 RepID=A0A9N8EGT6_9STRA|nr:expressed unknown protein [Seminavis robusta]|eukprot:Sro980_g227430.1 n/a (158) ;mRNA; r:28105-28578